MTSATGTTARTSSSTRRVTRSCVQARHRPRICSGGSRSATPAPPGSWTFSKNAVSSVLEMARSRARYSLLPWETWTGSTSTITTMKTSDARTTTTSAIAESVGALLRQAREEAGLSLTTVSARTKIPERYLAQFEQNGVGGPQEDVYSKIYLKAYAKFLGFDTS